MGESTAVIYLPAGVDAPRVTQERAAAQQRGMIVNETDLPDHVVERAVESYIDENASMLGLVAGQQSSYNHYHGHGSLLARRKFRTPTNVFDEICLSRDLAERDDDVRSTMGAMLAVAFGAGMQNTGEDEMVVALYNEIAENANLDKVFKEMYREYLISSQCVTATIFTHEDFTFAPQSGQRQRTRSVVAPLIGVLPAEQIRVIDNDMFGTGTLAYRPATSAQEQWLREYFDPQTSAGRKAEMRAEDPVLTVLLTGVAETSQYEQVSLFYSDFETAGYGNALYTLNPKLVHRTTMEKGAWKYPRPLMTANFALLEAKRLLNIMDYALLQGACNFLVVAKKGTDAKPAMPEEIANLRDVLRRSSSTGLIVGDHRLEIDIITPKLDELLNAEKRGLVGRKLASLLLRTPDFLEGELEGEAEASIELLQRVIASDRLDLRRHMQRGPYKETQRRNKAIVDDKASIWFPQIILQGLNFFTDLVLKLRDRGDISRRSAVEAGGFDYDSEVATRKREKAAGDDRVLTPPPVPFSSPNAGPQDNQQGRPPGTSPNNGAPGATRRVAPQSARPSRQITQNPGETVRAYHDETVGAYRAGELTHRILEQYPDYEIGRITAAEKRLIAFVDGEEWPGIMHDGPTTLQPVNPGYDLEDVRALKLAPGLRMLIGARLEDGALLARAFVFREPEYVVLDAEEKALEWGFPVGEEPAQLPSGDE